MFRDWPYLYDGTLDYEQGYMARFAASRGAVIVVARDRDNIVGAATGSPMREHHEDFAKPFRERGLDIAGLFYLGESVLQRAYRGAGVGRAFFAQREAHARRLGGYTHAAFAAVVRPPEHPLRPAEYVPLDGFWRRRGYEQVQGLTTSFEWLDVGGAVPTAKPMQFWIKALT